MDNGLFKYFATDLDKLERFTNRQIYFTPPKYFNDPWDFLARSDPHATEHIAREIPSLKGRALQEFADYVNTTDSLQAEAGEQQDGLSSLIGVVCLTEDPTNRIMWAHYGESHRGFVAEFRCPELPNHERKWSAFTACGTPFGPALKVSYNAEPPTMNADKTNLKEVFWTKHEAWRYEEEWRVIDSLAKGSAHPTRDGFMLLEFQPSDLLRLIFGLRVCPSVKSRLERMLNVHELRHVRKDAVFINSTTRRLDLRPLS
jgi:Protein of unknown function (DUF2971)